MGFFCSIYGQTTLILQTLWGKGFSAVGIYHSVQLLPPKDCLNCTFIGTRDRPVAFNNSFGKTFYTFKNNGNLIGKVCISSSAKEVDQGQDKRDQIGFGGGVGPL